MGGRRATRTVSSRAREPVPAPSGLRQDAAAEAAFDSAVAALLDRIPPYAAEQWIAPLVVLGAHGRTLCVGAESRIAEWVRRRYATALASELDGYELRVCDLGAS